MNGNDELMRRIAALSEEERGQVRDFVTFLEWRRGEGRSDVAAAQAGWRFNFLEHFAEADTRASKNPAGMEVKVAAATANGVPRPALWQHPPVKGESLVEYHVPVPAGVRDLRLKFSTGIRDGAQGQEQLVAFRVKVDGWQVWSRADWPRQWSSAEIELPFQAGNVLRLAFATDALGSHQWAWAAWAEPELVGRLAS
jgi:hypothetical protein